MKFENTAVMNFENAFRGMRNPKNSWHRSDSECLYHMVENWKTGKDPELDDKYNKILDMGVNFKLGDADKLLAQILIGAGNEHRKFMRQIFISVDITAPLYWWKEFDTYKVGTVANSTSTMHKLTSQPITLDCFEIDDYDESAAYSEIKPNDIINYLESLRLKYLDNHDKKYWKELIRWLPESWLQTRTVTMSYENIYSMVHQRQSHKLNEWSGKDDNSKINFISWAHSLPYADELLFYKN